jgi:hypothetical protein
MHDEHRRDLLKTGGAVLAAGVLRDPPHPHNRPGRRRLSRSGQPKELTAGCSLTVRNN